ncbi:MAG: hypothetical protein NTW26_01900 [bacterium]|nr:hypothetical protein [bacterium]
MQRSLAVFVLFAFAASATGAGTAVFPLDPGEWLSGGLSVWLARALDTVWYVAEMADFDTEPGNLAGMNRTAAADGLDRLLVVNCGYLGERVTLELFLFDTGDETLIGFWQGLINYDALPGELPSGLSAVIGDLDLPAVEYPAGFLDDRRADFTAYFGG